VLADIVDLDRYSIHQLDGFLLPGAIRSTRQLFTGATR
jgi:hypothetical protein